MSATRLPSYGRIALFAIAVASQFHAPSAFADHAGSDRGSDDDRTGKNDKKSRRQRGEYLVKNVAICGECHTPKKPDGTPDQSRWLAGVPDLFTVPGLGPNGSEVKVSPRNLTPDAQTGLGSWTDAQIKNAFMNGLDNKGQALFPIMPYSMLHNMDERDADAIVAYLRSIPRVQSPIPPRSFAWAQPAQPVPLEAIPNPRLSPQNSKYASALRGKYLAGNIGLCMDCHTKHVQGPVPLDMTKPFAGGENFDALPLPASFPKPILSPNITPDRTGIKHWNASDIVRIFRKGETPDGKQLCPPMPVGSTDGFGGLTRSDMDDIANYIVNLPPIANQVQPLCHDRL